MGQVSKIIGWIFLVLIVCLIAAALYAEISKVYWDRRVDELCAEDGGVSVFRRVVISAEDASLLGTVGGRFTLSPKKFSKGMSLFTVDSRRVLKQSYPQIVRSQRLVFHTGDKEPIGRIVSYTRIGGDALAMIAFPSSYRCPDIDRYYKEQGRFFEIKGLNNEPQ